MEPGQQEVEPGSLVRLLAHPRGWHCTEGTDEVSLHSRRGFKGEDTRASQKIDRHLQGLVVTCETVIPECAHLLWVNAATLAGFAVNKSVFTCTYACIIVCVCLLTCMCMCVLCSCVHPWSGSLRIAHLIGKKGSFICSITTIDLSTYLRVDLHGEEEPEVGVRSERVELLLQLHQPLRSKMDVLQQHPATSLRGRGDGLLSQTEAFSRT